MRNTAESNAPVKIVSIHAPVWGANNGAANQKAISSFNPRTRVGCELCNINRPSFRYCFNPRTRVGCEQVYRIVSADALGFNPRTRVGCEAKKFAEYITGQVSIHAPVWGANILFGKYQ